ncbi:MAG: RIP metalloprotease RseP [Aquificaceae bacterium]
METVVAFLVLIGVLVWFHELGHFLLAKFFGVKVEAFSIGFGPVLASKKLGETEYRLSAVPLGGYVKLYGEEEQTGDPRAYSSKPNWQKILIAFAGPMFNFLLAIFVFSSVFIMGRTVPSYILEKPVVGYVVPNSPAYKLGLRVGDTILELNGKILDTWKDLESVSLDSILKKNWSLKVLRNGQTLELFGKVELSRATGFGAEPYIKPLIGKVLPKSPAEQVGLQEGDMILEINGQKVNSWYDLVDGIKRSNVVNLKLKRGDRVFEKVVVPIKSKETGMPMLGISPYIETLKVSEPFHRAFLKSLEKVKTLTLLSVKAIWELLTGGLSLKTLGGPIAIAQLAGESAQQGVVAFLGMMAFMSVQLAVFNLIPLPVLDGGLILLFLIESLRRRRLSQKFKENWQRVGFAIIIALSVFVILNDILRVLTGNKV